MEYIAAAIRGDVEKVATLSFQCIMCGACAAKCPAEISQPNVAILARRIYGRHMLSLPARLYERISDIEKGNYDSVLEKLTRLTIEDLKKVYTKRDQEPQANPEWIPKNPNFPGDVLSDEYTVEELKTDARGATKQK